ncbi:hypothetical protein MC885_004574 [Smutsia gigantea]|nr:hypothetical protein MC885_004574 [Smutsia gigantea]
MCYTRSHLTLDPSRGQQSVVTELGKDKKTNKSMYECKKSEQYDTADVPTYEEVTPYRRQTNEKYRLVVLVDQKSQVHM